MRYLLAGLFASLLLGMTGCSASPVAANETRSGQSVRINPLTPPQVGCVFPNDNRVIEDQSTAPYGYTVFLTLSDSRGNGYRASGAIMRQLAPQGYVVILTAAHNFQGPGVSSPPIVNFNMWVPFTATLKEGIVNDLGKACTWQVSANWASDNYDNTLGHDWAFILCNTAKFSAGTFPSYQQGFGLLSNESPLPQLRLGVPGIGTGFPGDKINAPPYGTDMGVVSTSGKLTYVLYNNVPLLSMGNMSTSTGSSGGPVWSTAFNNNAYDNWINQYMVVGIISFQDPGDGSRCVSNYATYFGSSAAIELSVRVQQLVGVLPFQLQPSYYNTYRIAGDNNANPQISRVDPPNPPTPNVQWLFAKLTSPYSTALSSVYGSYYALISNTYITNAGTGWAVLTSLVRGADPICPGNGYKNSGCGSLGLSTAPLAVNTFLAQCVLRVEYPSGSPATEAYDFINNQPSPLYVTVPEFGNPPRLQVLNNGNVDFFSRFYAIPNYDEMKTGTTNTSSEMKRQYNAIMF